MKEFMIVSLKAGLCAQLIEPQVPTFLCCGIEMALNSAGTGTTVLKRCVSMGFHLQLMLVLSYQLLYVNYRQFHDIS